jgi:hypothetical protein
MRKFCACRSSRAGVLPKRLPAVAFRIAPASLEIPESAPRIRPRYASTRHPSHPSGYAQSAGRALQVRMSPLPPPSSSFRNDQALRGSRARARELGILSEFWELVSAGELNRAMGRLALEEARAQRRRARRSADARDERPRGSPAVSSLQSWGWLSECGTPSERDTGPVAVARSHPPGAGAPSAPPRYSVSKSRR